jgi:hypothetical protein
MTANITINTNILAAIPLQTISNNAVLQGQWIDVKGAEQIDFVIAIGQAQDADATFAIKIEEADQADYVDASDVPESYLIGTLLTAAFTYASDNQLRLIGVRCRKRYYRISIVPANNSGSLTVASLAYVSRYQYIPAVVVAQTTTPPPPPSGSAPVNTDAPTITDAGSGVLNLNNGTWTGSPAPTFSRQLLRNGTLINADAGTTHTANVEDFGAVFTLIVTATNASAPSGVTATSAAFNVPLPFTSDAETFWYDFASTINTQNNTIGTETIAYVRERVGNKTPLVQPLKDMQAIKSSTAAHGVGFNQATRRQMQMESPAGITNGKTGFYAAFNCRCDNANSGALLSIARAANANPARGYVLVPANREFGIQWGDNEGASVTSIARAPAITIGQWYTLEIQVDTVANTVTIWYNGVLQTLSFSSIPDLTNYPATNPSEVCIGNHSNLDNVSFEGALQHVVFYNGVPSSGIRSSISAYLNSVRP